MNRSPRWIALAPIAAVLWLGAACASNAPVDLPNETLVVNMNAKIDDATRAKVEADLDALFESEKEIF